MPLLGAGKTEKFGTIGNNARADGTPTPNQSGNSDMSYSRFWTTLERLTGLYMLKPPRADAEQLQPMTVLSEEVFSRCFGQSIADGY